LTGSAWEKGSGYTMKKNDKVLEGSSGPHLDYDYFRRTLNNALDVLKGREAAIRKDVRSGLDSDSKERAVELENSEVLNALSDDAYLQIQAIQQALSRLDSGKYGVCDDCGNVIVEGRLRAYPQTVLCTSCASDAVG
jgi:RNA polymerase-binding transcription factor DksA